MTNRSPSGRHESNATCKSVVKDSGSTRLTGNGSSSATLLSCAPGHLFTANRVVPLPPQPPPPDPSATNIHRRCVAKNGVANIRHAKISRKNQRFFMDTFTTMVDIEWRFNLLVFALSFISSWMFFACIWWTVAYQHGDLALQNSEAAAVTSVSQVVSTDFDNSVVMSEVMGSLTKTETTDQSQSSSNWFELFCKTLNQSLQEISSLSAAENKSSSSSSLPVQPQLIELIHALNLSQALKSSNTSD